VNGSLRLSLVACRSHPTRGDTIVRPAAPACGSASSGVGEEGVHSGVLSLSSPYPRAMKDWIKVTRRG
jgi:hypothetical protein